MDSVEKNSLSVLIIGCGNIAGGYDQGRPIGGWPYSHAGAYLRDGRFNLLGCIDPDEKKRIQFMSDWSIDVGFDSIDEVIRRQMYFDVISICSPTHCHASDLRTALLLNPKLVFCEKPVTTAVNLTEDFVSQYNKAQVHLMVNHNRRWDPEIIKFRNQIYEGRWGELRAVNAIYNKGILNNGVHMIDLLQFLIGPMKVFAVGKGIVDFYHQDPTIPVWLSGPQDLPVYLACGHAADYAIFEIQFIFAGGVITMEDGGQYWRKRMSSPGEVIKGYRVLDGGVLIAGGDDQSMSLAVDNIYRTVIHHDHLASCGETALQAQKMCEDIRYLSGLYERKIKS